MPYYLSISDLASRVNEDSLQKVRVKYGTSINKTPKPNKKVKYEEVDTEKYKSSARCVTFKTSPDHIFVLVVRVVLVYHDTLGDSADFDIAWRDVTDSDSSNPKVLEVQITVMALSDGQESENFSVSQPICPR